MACQFDQVIDRKNTYCVKWDALLDNFGSEDLIPMWVADMDFPPPPEVVEAIKKRAGHGIYGYEYKPAGYQGAFVNWLLERHNWQVEPDWITNNPGVVPGLTIALLALTKPGDPVVIQPPVYPPFYRIVQENGRKVIENSLKFSDGRFTIDFADLERHFRNGAKFLIFCSPHNPVGRVWSKQELDRLAELTSRYGVIVFSDEIWADLVLPGYQHTPLAAISPEMAARTLTFMAPSKTFNLAGFHFANTIISNPVLREKFNQQMGRLNLTHSNIFGIIASEAAYKFGAPWLDALLVYLNENIDYTIRELARITDDIQVIKPESTYVLWLDCRKLNIPPAELNNFFTQKAGLALNDGRVFGEMGSGFQRMNIGCPRSLIKEAMERLERVL